MISFSIYVLALILNLAPGNAAKFTASGPQEQKFSGVKLENGSWDVTMDGQTVNMRVEDGKLIAKKSSGAESPIPLKELLQAEKEPDWAKIEELKIGELTMKIKRSDNGVELNAEGGPEEVWKVTWETKPAK